MATEVRKDLYGVGFSPLSIKNKEHAIDEEMLANKDIGLVGIYQEDDGTVVSAEYLSRAKKHLENFVATCIAEGVVGKIYNIGIDETYGRVITRTTNLFDNVVSISNRAVKPTFLRFSVDCDYFIRNNSIGLSPSNVNATVIYSIIVNGNTQSFTFTDNLVELAQKVYAVDYSPFPSGTFSSNPALDSYTVRLDSFTITLPSNYNPSTSRFVVRGLLFSTN